MENTPFTQNIRELRQRCGFSQEELAERSGLSLRTVQRIENGETEPRGDSLKRIAGALGVTPNDLVEWAMQENRHFLSSLNLSALTFLFFPLLGIIVSYILWSGKRDTVKGAERTGKEIVNFQITWTILLFFIPVIAVLILSRGFHAVVSAGDVSPSFVAGPMKLSMLMLVGGSILFNLYNLTLILVNQWRIGKGKPVRYVPKIKWLK